MRRFTIILIIFLLNLTLIGAVFAATTDTKSVGGNTEEIDELNKQIAEKRDKIKKLEESIELYKKEISKKELEAVSLSNALAVLDNRMVQLNLDIEATQTKLDALNLEIQSLTLLIDDKTAVIERQKKLLSELVRTIHENQAKSIIEVFAAYESFSDFYNRLQHLRTIEEDLGSSARTLRLAKEELEGKKTQQEDIKQSYETVKGELVAKRETLEEETVYRSSLLAQTQSSEQKYRVLLDGLRRQYQQIEGEITGIEREVRRRLEANNDLDQLEGDTGDGFSWPTQSKVVTCGFHCGGYPFANVFLHSGMDIRAAHGTPIRAAASGYVARAKRCSESSCYSFIMIIHSNGLSTVYGHLSGINVKEDDFVARGDIIGLSGGTPGTAGAGPFVTGAHLHFEVRSNGVPVDPAPYMAN